MTATKSKVVAAKQLRFLHWLMAFCFFPIFILGIYMARTELPQGAYRSFVYQFHESMGILVLLLLAARILVFLRKHLPLTKHKHRQGWIKTVALHTGLYVFMLAVPFSGYLLISAADVGIPFFGIGSLLGFRLPPLVGKNEAIAQFVRSWHTWLAYIFLILITLHIVLQRKFLRTTWRRAFKPTTVTNASGQARHKT